MLVDDIEKEPYGKWGYGVRYHKVLAAGENIVAATSSLLATRLIDSVDVTSTFLGSAIPSVPGGTATGGSTTQIINTATNHADDGWKVGDHVVNHTQGWTAQVVEIKKTTNANDTLVIKPQAVATVNLDVYTAAKAIASLQAGLNGERIQVRFRVITDLGNQFEDDLIVRVKDH